MRYSVGASGGMLEIISELLISISTVEIISIDHGKRAVDNITRCTDCVHGAPWFFTSFRDRKAIREVV